MDKHVMIDIDQDYNTNDIDEKSQTLNKKHKNNNVIETNLNDVIELSDINNKNNNNNDIKKILDNNNLLTEPINITNRISDTDIDIDNVITTTLNLQKNQLKSKIFNKKIIEHLQNSLENEIEDASMWRFTWVKIATSMFCISEVLMIIQTALSFTAAAYQILLISYLAGVIGVVAIGLNRFAAYSKHQSTEKTNQLNKLLKTIGIDNNIPDLVDYTDKKDKVG